MECDPKVERYEQGLFLLWTRIHNKKRQKISKILSIEATCGTIFSCNIPYDFYKTAFQPMQKKDFYSCYFVACNSGEIFVIDIQNSENIRHICYCEGNVIWCYVLNISGTCSLILVKNTGELCYGNFSAPKHAMNSFDFSSLFTWNTKSLSISPICCVDLDAALIIADGHSSIICDLVIDKSSSNLISIKETRLSIFGAVSLSYQNFKVNFTICDGRKYKKTLQELKILAEDAEENDDNLNFGHLNLTEALQASKRINEDIKRGNEQLENINNYIDQLSLAHQLLLSGESKRLFQVNFNATPSLEKENSFILTIEISVTLPNHKMKGKWWNIKVKLKNCLNYYSKDISPLYNNNKYIINVHIPNLLLSKMIDGSESDVVLDIMLIFSHFSTLQPLCSVHVQNESLDVFNFLSLQKQAINCDWPIESSFEKMILHLQKQQITKSSNFTYLKTTKYFKESVELLENNQHIVSFIFPQNKDSDSNTLWFRDLFVNFTKEKRKMTNSIVINMECSCEQLVKILKLNLEKRALMSNCGTSLVRLYPDVLRNAHLLTTSLRLENSTNSNPFIIDRMSKNVIDLLATIPI